MKSNLGQSFKRLAFLLVLTIVLSPRTNPAAKEAANNPNDSTGMVGIQTNFDHRYRRYARLLQETISNGRPTPEAIVRTSSLRDSIRTEFLRITAENMGQWDLNQQIAYLINIRNVLLLSRIGRDITDSTELVVASRTMSLQSLDSELARRGVRDPRFTITLFSTVPFGPAWSSDPVKAESLDSTLTELWRDYLNRPEVMTMNSAQKRIAVNRWLGEFSDNLSSDWAGSSRFVNADPEVAPLLAFLWSVADGAMRTRLESTDQWRLVRPPVNPIPLNPPRSILGDIPETKTPGQ